jgi:hypothetical protein
MGVATLQAQTATGENPEKDELKQFFVETIEKASVLSTKGEAINFFRENLSPNYRLHSRVFFNGEQINDVEIGFKELMAGEINQRLPRSVQTENSFEDIHFLQTSGDIGVVNSTYKLIYKDNDEVLSEGREVRVDRLIKTDNGWKFLSSSSDVVITGVNRAPCTYQYFSDGSPTALVKVNYPNGRIYESLVIELTFNRLDDNAQEIYTSEGDVFLWKNGKMTMRGDQRVQMDAGSPTEVAEKLIPYYIGESCTTVKSVK